MHNHCFFLSLAAQILSRDLNTCCCRTFGGKVLKQVPLGNLSVRAVYHNCSVPVGQANFFLSFRWGIVKQFTKSYTNHLFLVELFNCQAQPQAPTPTWGLCWFYFQNLQQAVRPADRQAPGIVLFINFQFN